jgi:hypothetical protein
MTDNAQAGSPPDVESRGIEQIRHAVDAGDSAQINALFNTACTAVQAVEAGRDEASWDGLGSDELVEMIRIIADGGFYNQAEDLAREEIPDWNDQSRALAAVVRAAVAAHRVDLAERIASTIPQPHERAAASAVVAAADGDNSARLEAALQCAYRVSFAEERAYALLTLVTELTGPGRLD